MTPQQFKDLMGLFGKRYGRLLILVIIGIIIAVGVLIGHRLQQDRHTSMEVNAWHKKHNALIDNLKKDFLAAERDSKANSLDGLVTDCTQVHTDATAAQQAPKIPDPNIQRYWAAALQYDVTGSSFCIQGASQGNNTYMEDANSYFNKGSNALQIVSNELKKAAQQK